MRHTKQFAIKVQDLVDELPKSTSGRIVANQLSRSGTAIAANVRDDFGEEHAFQH